MDFKVAAVGQVLPSGNREVFLELNGSPTSIVVTDKSAAGVTFSFPFPFLFEKETRFSI